MAAKIARDANVGEENQEYYVLMVATVRCQAPLILLAPADSASPC